MEPFDPPEARSAASYNWKSQQGSYKPKTNWKKFLHHFVLAVLAGAVIGLLYVNWYEAKVIAAQRNLIIEMYQFIVQGCPTFTLN